MNERTIRQVYFNDCNATRTDAALVEYVTEQSARLQALRDALSKRIDEIDAIIGSIDSESVERLQQDVLRLNVRVGTISQELAEQGSFIENLSTDLTGISNSIAALAQDIAQNSSDIESINAAGYQTAAEVESAISGKGYQTAAQVESAISGKGYQTAAQVESAIAASKPKYCKAVRTATSTTSATAGAISDLPMQQLEMG